jgi:hypothetical protein
MIVGYTAPKDFLRRKKGVALRSFEEKNWQGEKKRALFRFIWHVSSNLILVDKRSRFLAFSYVATSMVFSHL